MGIYCLALGHHLIRLLVLCCLLVVNEVWQAWLVDCIGQRGLLVLITSDQVWKGGRWHLTRAAHEMRVVQLSLLLLLLEGLIATGGGCSCGIPSLRTGPRLAAHRCGTTRLLLLLLHAHWHLADLLLHEVLAGGYVVLSLVRPLLLRLLILLMELRGQHEVVLQGSTA